MQKTDWVADIPSPLPTAPSFLLSASPAAAAGPSPVTVSLRDNDTNLVRGLFITAVKQLISLIAWLIFLIAH